jgi:hypothetical protein
MLFCSAAAGQQKQAVYAAAFAQASATLWTLLLAGPARTCPNGLKLSAVAICASSTVFWAVLLPAALLQAVRQRCAGLNGEQDVKHAPRMPALVQGFARQGPEARRCMLRSHRFTDRRLSD